MLTMRSFLSSPLWGGISVIISIIISLIGFYLSGKQKIWLNVASIFTILIIGLFVGSELSASNESIYQLVVSADSSYPFPHSNITVHQGDDVEITVQGSDSTWSCGLDFVSPYGHVNDKKPEEYYPAANVCELIGHIGDGAFFRVGAYTSFVSTESGTLYLGANDAKDCSIAKDCYFDNKGKLYVIVKVK